MIEHVPPNPRIRQEALNRIHHQIGSVPHRKVEGLVGVSQFESQMAIVVAAHRLTSVPFPRTCSTRFSEWRVDEIGVLDYTNRRCRLFRNRKLSVVSSSLVETAVSIAVAATVVGTAATLLSKRTKASQVTEIPMKTCEDCNGSGICPECRGEGFVLKRLSEETAERARLTAKNMATRYTAGLPKKWSYCTKCSSSRSCITCDGRGKLSEQVGM